MVSVNIEIRGVKVCVHAPAWECLGTAQKFHKAGATRIALWPEGEPASLFWFWFKPARKARAVPGIGSWFAKRAVHAAERAAK